MRHVVRPNPSSGVKDSSYNDEHEMPSSTFDIRMFPLQSIPVNDITIGYREFGNGPPLLLINGFCSTMDTWNPRVLEKLSDDYRVIVFDNRGTGYSSAGTVPFSISLFALDTIALLEALGISRVFCIGLSMGSYIAQEIALRCPDLIMRLILVSGDCGGNESEQMSSDILEKLADKSGTPEQLAERMFSVLFPPSWLETHNPWDYCPEVYETIPEETATSQMNAIDSWDGTCRRLPGLQVPALVITGSDDVVIPAKNSLVLAGLIPGSWLVQFRGGGHGLIYQFPDDFTAIVRFFLKFGD
jgi:pimeloyl-ACP methyl ester carboxylesterase